MFAGESRRGLSKNDIESEDNKRLLGDLEYCEGSLPATVSAFFKGICCGFDLGDSNSCLLDGLRSRTGLLLAELAAARCSAITL